MAVLIEAVTHKWAQRCCSADRGCYTQKFNEVNGEPIAVVGPVNTSVVGLVRITFIRGCKHKNEIWILNSLHCWTEPLVIIIA